VDFACRGRRRKSGTNLPLNPPTRYGPWFYRAVARLKPGVTLEQAQAETNRIALLMRSATLLQTGGAAGGPAARRAPRNHPQAAILVLAGAVGLVLLIAVVNVANLMLARATRPRARDGAPLSLGAGRGRLVRQLLTENVLLSVMGGAAGLAVAWGSSS